MTTMPANIVIAPSAAIYENTPVLQKVECAIISQGTIPMIQWELRDSEGYPIDLSGIFISTDKHHKFDRKTVSKCDNVWDILSALNPNYYNGEDEYALDDTFYIEARIQPASEPVKPMWIVPCKVVDAQFGILQFEIPKQPSDWGGIYVVSIGLCRNSDNQVLYVHKGLISVERSAWRSPQVDCKCPSIMEIRARILDTDVENLLQGYVEFSNADILDSIVSAVREWNGTTPHLAQFTFDTHTFPFIENWMDKIIASLYTKASLRYARNKLQINHGGVSGDDLARDQQYIAIAKEYDTRWKEWLKVKKRELNLNQFNGLVRSPYHGTINEGSYHHRFGYR